MSSTDSQLDSILDQMDHGRAFKGAILMNEKPEHWVPYAQPLLDAVSLFQELRIGYALIGGIAAMYYGRARFTEDVDFVAATGHPDILSAHSAEMEKHYFDPSCVYKLYHQSGVQVDLWKDEHADAIVQRAGEVALAGRLVRIIEPHDLIAMKLRAGRLKDDYDIGQIAAATALVDSRLQALVTSEQFERFTALRKRQ